MSAGLSEADWEVMWAPYDESTYAAVLAQITPQDTVLEIGAGDLRLARRMATIARRVYAVEINPWVLERGVNEAGRLPDNLVFTCADARVLEIPPGVTLGVLLMRHCKTFNLYAEKLRGAGCKRMITNARWRMSVETIDLQAYRPPFAKIPMGWYACWCGATGFKSGDAQSWTAEMDEITHEVTGCPQCNTRVYAGS